MKNRLNLLAGMFLLVPAAVVAAELPEYVTEELERSKSSCAMTLERLYSRHDLGDFHEGLMFSEITGVFDQIEYCNSKRNEVYLERIGKISVTDMKNMKRSFYQDLEKQSQVKAIAEMEKSRFSKLPQVFARHKYLCENVIKAEGCDCENGLREAALAHIANQELSLETETVGRKELEERIMAVECKLEGMQKELQKLEEEKALKQKKLREHLDKIRNFDAKK